ncbi:MAG: DUF4393 domain-containing protein [Burkholderiales bacterium]
MLNETLPMLKAAVQVPSLLKEIYGDIAKPGVSQVGKALGTVLGLGNTLLLPITLLNERARMALQNNLEKYRAQLENVPPENIVCVPPEIGVPITEKLTYVSNEEISNLYVNLLAKASTADNAGTAHPRFVSIINGLSPDEALLFPHIQGQLPFLEGRISEIVPGDGFFIPVPGLMTGLERSVQLTYPENLDLYLNNFESLGLINLQRNVFIAEPIGLYDQLSAIYQPAIEKAPYFDKYRHRLTFIRGKMQISPLGVLFGKACLFKLQTRT